ncbi:cytoplasmic protein [Salmonella enterica]|nr:cytoplasmic protein [Salmonella enterica]EJH7440905.1 cytoplasmic protein [Salmonella enterica]EJH7880280.1 cytoplasmic protein [Salmonella enterica]EJI6713029.1 cytoplasmic protein [Salmonella enterica]EJX0634180.1 cytoplasmic protein [Salmonella enterica]
MSEDYVIEWDSEYADDINVLASFFFKESPEIWTTTFSRLATAPESFEEDDDYDIQDVIDCSGGDLDNYTLVQTFLSVLRGENLIEVVDWKGEEEKGQLANFAAARFYALTKDISAAEELKTILLEITQEDKIEEACENGGRYVDEVFERIQAQLNHRGFQIGNLNEGADAYNVFVLPMSSYEKIADFGSQWLDVQDFLG